MKLNAVCVQCMIDGHVNNVSKLTNVDEDTKAMYMRDVMQTILDFPPESPSPVFVPAFDDLKRKYFGVEPFDYTETNLKYDKMIMDLYDEIRDEIEKSDDPVLTAIKYSMAANYIDFSSVDVKDDELMTMLSNASAAPLDDSEYFEHMKEDLAKAEKLLFICDNGGEVVLDKLLVEQIKLAYPDLHIDIMVKGKPAANDATLVDAEYVKLSEVANVIDSGIGIAGNPLNLIKQEALDAVKNADVIISKGQANFETMYGSGYNIYYVFLVKCNLFQHLFGLKKFSAVIENELRISDLTAAKE
ncbi:MAG: DUF89 family protein [Oscillospiraceae bacterium]|nr:DUF89 family protein [Oscillospiraceae bacterium]